MIHLLQGDITLFEGDAIVNAANSSLRGGGGVDGAIHKAAGPALLQECQEWVRHNGDLPTGKAMITKGGNLKARWVIHTVGPVWSSGTQDEDFLLSQCYINCLHLCVERNIRTVAFPNISTGVYGFPKTDAAEVAVASVRNFLSSSHTDLEVSFMCFDEENYTLYQKLL